ncbi:MAG: hypothetical protein LDL41_16345 [Coleofasciculus sp. S288]|nr:hypothetical protein [Coleofasciculus sp. S288]
MKVFFLMPVVRLSFAVLLRAARSGIGSRGNRFILRFWQYGRDRALPSFSHAGF